MKSHVFKFFSFAFVVFLLSASGLDKGVTESKNEVLMRLIMDRLNDGHYEMHTINDDFSTQVFNLYLKRLDYQKRYFTQEDVKQMQAYHDKIDDEIKDGSYEFFELSNRLFEKRMKQAEGFFTKILDKPFDFTIDETVDLDYEFLEYAKDDKELKDRWRKFLKYSTLSRTMDKMFEQEKAVKDGNDTLEIKSFDKLEEEARAKILKNYTDWYKRMEQTDISDRRTTFLNAITNIYDPHTGYFPPKDKENFDIRMSGRLEGIGATLTVTDGYVKVNSIVPGSASWKQGQLKTGDLILKVAQGKEEPVDIVDMKLDNAVQLIRGPKGTEVRLTVKKMDGEIMVIPIIRDVVILDETYAKSAVLKKKKGGKVGYIQLPKFYADFNKKNGRNCSGDIRKELEKLQSEGIEGIVLDLRNNGGGSLHDVVRMAGFFIDKGPIVQIKSRGRAPYIMEDKDEAVQYDGPLVIMVNSFSASASEILAAAIQDYGRGVIIGSPSTFGKGTVQRFVNLDDYIRNSASDEIKPLGAVKLTTQKFYRINGGATQLKGVIPDIIIPDAYAYIDNGEKERDHPMEWDEIPSVNYKTWEHDINLEKLKKKSEARIKNNSDFQLMDGNAKRNKRLRQDKSYPLLMSAYRTLQESLKKESEIYKDMMKDEIPGLTVTTLKADVPVIEADSSKMARFEAWHKKILKDEYINEALSVIQDMD